MKANEKVTPAPLQKKKIALNVTLPAETEHLNAIVYGASGAGKTHLLGTAVDCEEMSPPLFLDFENGTRTLHGLQIDVIRPQSWKEIQEIYEFLLHENNKYRSVLLDSATEIQKKYSLGTIMGEMEEGQMSYVDLGRTESPKMMDWNRTGGQMRKVIRSFRDLAYLSNAKRRVHVVFTALEAYREKKELMCPSLIGTLSEDCGAMVDFLMRLSRQTVTENNEEGEEVRIMRRHLLTDDYINEDGIQYMGKNRDQNMTKSIWDPTMTKIIEATRSSKPKKEK